MTDRYWTLDEANAALGHVTAVVDRARSALEELRSKAEEATARAGGNGHAKRGSEREIFAEAVRELAADGIILRDVDQGLIDFPAKSEGGRQYWLCWLVGEPQVAWWHFPQDGFAGRMSIESLPE